MKKNIIASFFLVFCALLVSCSSGDRKLQKLVNDLNAMCPVEMGAGISMDAVSYDNHAITLHYDFPDGLLDIDAIKANDASFRTNMLASYANNSNESFQDLIDLIIQSKAQLVVTFSTTSGKSHSIIFTSDELKDNVQNASANTIALLQSVVDNTKLQLPMPVDEGILFTDVLLEDGYYINVYSCDESIYDIIGIRSSAGEVKEAILEECLDKDNSLMVYLRKLLVDANYGLAYKYVGDTSGDACMITIEPSELQ